MTSGSQSPGDSFARGLFGTFQQAAAAGRDTAGVWSALRESVADWYYTAQGLPTPDDPNEVQAQGASILSQRGIGITQVNAMRAQAGQWLGARDSLIAATGEQNITSSSIFSPSWRTTGLGRANPAQYRIRILRGIGLAGQEGTQFESWSTYDLGATLGTVDQLVARANQAYGRQRYAQGTFINDVLQYEIEVI